MGAGLQNLQKNTPACRLLLDERHLTAANLAQHLGVAKSRVTTVVKELERKNYIKRRAHPEDRRVKLLSLTDEGTAKRKEIVGLLNAMHTRVLVNVDPKLRSGLMAYLELLGIAMETVEKEFGITGRKFPS